MNLAPAQFPGVTFVIVCMGWQCYGSGHAIAAAKADPWKLLQDRLL